MDAESITDLWPSIAAFADDIGERPGTVYVWRSRGAVPSAAIPRVVAAARRRGIPLDIDRDGNLAPSDPPEAAA